MEKKMNSNIGMKLKSCPTWVKIAFIDIVSFILAYFLINYLDILTHDYKWIQVIKQNGLFHVYDSFEGVIPVDLPPLYIFWLYVIKDLVGNEFSNFTQLIMKLLPLVVQIIAQIFIYKKISPEAALKWSVNAAILVNIVYYGQRDGIVGLLIILFFYFMYKEKWLLPALSVACLALFKPQGFYFVFILLLYYFVKKVPFKKVLIAFLLSVSIGYLVFLPFAIASGEMLISIKLYLFDFSFRKVFGSIAGNIWGLFEYWPIPGWLSKISLLLILLCMVIAIFVYRKTSDFIYTSVVYMFLVYMITFSQQGRYSIYTMFIMFAGIFIYGREEYKNTYVFLMLSALLGQVGMLAYNKTIVDYFGLEVINTSVTMSYSMRSMLWTLRYIFIILTFLINIYCFWEIISMKRSSEISAEK